MLHKKYRHIDVDNMSLRRKELYEKLVTQIQAPLMKFGEKLSRNKTLQILRDAFMLAFPLTIFGSITLIIANFPFLAQIIGESAAASLNAMLGPASTATMSIATVFTVLGIGYYFSCDRKVDPIFGAAIAPAAFAWSHLWKPSSSSRPVALSWSETFWTSTGWVPKACLWG